MFNIEDFDIKLETNTIGRNFIYTEEISSTNEFLLKNSENFDNGTIVLSEFQEEGRGRFKRPWLSNKGENLTFSILLKENLSAFNPNHVNLMSSLTISLAIENLYQLKPSLKWPNDVLINNKKVCGILMEANSKGSELKSIVIGIGLNANQTKFSGEYRVTPTSIQHEVKRVISRERFLSEFLNIFEEQLWELSKNPKKMLDDWRERCRLIGEKIAIEDDGEKKYGIFYDIDANGMMILKIGDKLEKIINGDISIR
ncbi:MAG: biotin--[acetyl-CoA-carboxylase] ligase [Ignavibacteriae bacterium]|nr:MAG: biotin--[acetyl-CoA-carboxylase] ligase [Ignavibacteriota bacterium]